MAGIKGAENQKEEKKEAEFKEPKKIRWNVADAIEVVSTSLRNSKMNIKKTQKYQEAMNRLQSYFSTDEAGVQLLSMIICHYFGSSGSSYGLQYIASDIDCSPMKVVSWKKYIPDFVEQGYLVVDDNWLTNTNNPDFNASNDLISAVVNNCEIFIIDREQKEDYIWFLTSFGEMYESRNRKEQSTCSLHYDLNKLENKHGQLPFIQECRDMIPDSWARFIFYDMCKDFLQGSDSNLNATIADLYDSSRRFKIATEFMNETHILFKKELVEFGKKGNMTEATVTLSQKGKKLLLGEDAALYDQRVDERLLIKPENIKEKHLFYSEEVQKQIDNLKSALSDEKLSQIQARLKEDSLPVGVAVLLYGSPGTGKTESVYQIARETGRPIVHVDISDTKSCWFGESEKLIKKVFKSYHNMCDQVINQAGGKMPILLFNEADAIFGKRKDTDLSNVAQTENAIQNIILEEMENLKGIMIATTNLTKNLDSAFERRFLFKLHFENPSVEAKKAIWIDKLSWLSEETAGRFASAYDFSGGEIDNIVRKATMQEVITGKRVSEEELEDLCKTEKLDSIQSRHVGFIV
ncbi:MAG: ATP-binding protein [Treponema sp.]|nr:ATP-binding protein [Treponema sp.]